MTRKLFVTTALPYANAAFHIGHMMEYIQADIWVRFQRMLGHEVHFVCADDAHGAPIMIAADKAGQTPQQFVAHIAAGRKQYLDGFHIGFDNWHSTDGPENHDLAKDIYRALRKNELISAFDKCPARVQRFPVNRWSTNDQSRDGIHRDILYAWRRFRRRIPAVTCPLFPPRS